MDALQLLLAFADDESDRELSTLRRVVGRILDSENPCLPAMGWLALDRQTKVSKEFRAATILLSDVFRARSDSEFQQKSTKTEETFADAYETMFKTLRPVLASLETYYEERDAMTELGAGRPVRRVTVQRHQRCTHPSSYDSPLPPCTCPTPPTSELSHPILHNSRDVRKRSRSNLQKARGARRRQGPCCGA